MSLIAKLLVSLIIAVIGSTLTSALIYGNLLDLKLIIGFFLATVSTALIVGGTNIEANTGSQKAKVKPRPAQKPERTQPRAKTSSQSSAGRETGEVKWFNVSKGFGFITMDSGEEIFVHFRSIRGEGRRSLRDGQRVNFVVADSDKGPHADDVVGED